MNRRNLIAFTAVALVVISGASIIALNKNGQTPVSSIPRADTTDTTLPVEQAEQRKKETALKEYSDPSGYRFLYPSNLSIVVENKADDPEIYSSLKIKPSTGVGTITINVNTTNLKSLDEWVKANKIPLTSPSIKRIKLADIDAYQLPIQTQLVTGAYDQGALFVILITEPENQALLSAYEKIISSFSFYQPVASEDSATTEPAPDHSSIVDTESEEVIE